MTTRDLVVPPIAGLTIRHRFPADLKLSVLREDEWSGSEPVGDEVIVHHRVDPLPVDGLRITADASPWCVYYEGPRGEEVIRFRAIRDAVPAQTLRTLRPGQEYEMRYDVAPTSPVMHYVRDRNIWTLALAHRGQGLLAHACGFLLPGGGGAVAPGISGAGKTTLGVLLMQLAASVVPLSDDRIAITTAGGHYRLWGTPWHGDGKITNPRHGALRVVAFPGKAATPTLTRLTSAEAARRWLNTFTLPLWNSALTDWALGFIDRLVSEVPHVDISYPATLEAASWVVHTLDNEGRT